MDKLKKWYSPHEFAKIVGLTKRALRYYNEQGILQPSFVNEQVFGFYSEQDFFEAQRIVSLRFLQFSIEEIKQIQTKDADVLTSLQQQKQMMKEKAEQILRIVDTIGDMERAIGSDEDVCWDEVFNSVKFAKYQMVHDNMMKYYNERAEELHKYQCAFIGFLLGHFTKVQEEKLLGEDLYSS